MKKIQENNEKTSISKATLGRMPLYCIFYRKKIPKARNTFLPPLLRRIFPYLPFLYGRI